MLNRGQILHPSSHSPIAKTWSASTLSEIMLSSIDLYNFAFSCIVYSSLKIAFSTDNIFSPKEIYWEGNQPVISPTLICAQSFDFSFSSMGAPLYSLKTAFESVVGFSNIVTCVSLPSIKIVAYPLLSIIFRASIV